MTHHVPFTNHTFYSIKSIHYRYMDQIKAKENADSKLDVPRKHVSVADVRRSLNIEKKVWRNIGGGANPIPI